MSDVKCAGMMFRAAERDFLTLQSMTAGAPEESFGFHVQQAAEKAFKAWLALLGEMYPLTHNLEALLDILADRGVATEPFRKLIEYTPYAVEFPYEGVDASTESIDREDALTLVEALVEQARRELAEVEGDVTVWSLSGLLRTRTALSDSCPEHRQGRKGPQC